MFPADLDYAFRCPEGRLDVGCPGSLLRSFLRGIPLLIPLLLLLLLQVLAPNWTAVKRIGERASPVRQFYELPALPLPPFLPLDLSLCLLFSRENIHLLFFLRPLFIKK